MPIQPRTRSTLITALLLGLLVAQDAARAEDAPSAPPAAPSTTPTQVRVTTNMGDFVIEVRADRAPLTAQNFLRYVREGFYNGTLFHRVVANFVVQGGGFDATTQKLKPTHDSIFNESGNGLQNKRGAVGMARSDPPHSGNSQFFVDLVDNPDLDPVPTRWGYTVFGRVVSGMDVVDRIGETATGSAGPFKVDAPLKPVIIQKAEIIGAAAAAAPAAATPVTPARTDDNILSPK
jgi:peptidyl-prolyl cis-trans isomerase A (cyclophilin A)/peptidyl-prolyl cis-trans isomerase B (cyclophilin B)